MKSIKNILSAIGIILISLYPIYETNIKKENVITYAEKSNFKDAKYSNLIVDDKIEFKFILNLNKT